MYLPYPAYGSNGQQNASTQSINNGGPAGTSQNSAQAMMDRNKSIVPPPQPLHQSSPYFSRPSLTQVPPSLGGNTSLNGPPAHHRGVLHSSVNSSLPLSLPHPTGVPPPLHQLMQSPQLPQQSQQLQYHPLYQQSPTQQHLAMLPSPKSQEQHLEQQYLIQQQQLQQQIQQQMLQQQLQPPMHQLFQQQLQQQQLQQQLQQQQLQQYQLAQQMHAQTQARAQANQYQVQGQTKQNQGQGNMLQGVQQIQPQGIQQGIQQGVQSQGIQPVQPQIIQHQLQSKGHPHGNQQYQLQGKRQLQPQSQQVQGQQVQGQIQNNQLQNNQLQNNQLQDNQLQNNQQHQSHINQLLPHVNQQLQQAQVNQQQLQQAQVNQQLQQQQQQQLQQQQQQQQQQQFQLHQHQQLIQSQVQSQNQPLQSEHSFQYNLGSEKSPDTIEKSKKRPKKSKQGLLNEDEVDHIHQLQQVHPGVPGQLTPQSNQKKKRGRPRKLLLDPSTNEYIDSTHSNFKQLNKLLRDTMSPGSQALLSNFQQNGMSGDTSADSSISKLYEQPTYLRTLEDEAVKQLLQKKDKRGRPRKFPVEQTGITIKGIRVNGNLKNRVKKPAA